MRPKLQQNLAPVPYNIQIEWALWLKSKINKATKHAKGRDINSAATFECQRAASHSLSFIISIVIMALCWGFFVGLAAESCSRIWLSCLIRIVMPRSSNIRFFIYTCPLRNRCRYIYTWIPNVIIDVELRYLKFVWFFKWRWSPANWEWAQKKQQ